MSNQPGLSTRFGALATVLSLTMAVNTVSPTDPKIRVRITEDQLITGEHARVKVKTASDGYVVVLRMDTEGHVRVLYPVDPTDNANMKGGKEWEVRSRGDREAFVAAERTGSGLILAARSDAPLNFSAFTANQRWNAAALVPESEKSDAEGALLSIVDRMSGGHFDYDEVSYGVQVALPRAYYGNPFYSSRYVPRYSPFYDPWYSYGAFGPGSFYVPSFGFGVGFTTYFPSHRRVFIGRRR